MYINEIEELSNFGEVTKESFTFFQNHSNQNLSQRSGVQTFQISTSVMWCWAQQVLKCDLHKQHAPNICTTDMRKLTITQNIIYHNQPHFLSAAIFQSSHFCCNQWSYYRMAKFKSTESVWCNTGAGASSKASKASGENLNYVTIHVHLK